MLEIWLHDEEDPLWVDQEKCIVKFLKRLIVVMQYQTLCMDLGDFLKQMSTSLNSSINRRRQKIENTF